MSLLGLPWLHLALPHSDLHVRSLGESQERISGGVIREKIIEKTVLEQRVTSLLGHLIIGIALIPDVYKHLITSIPEPILDGIFLFLAVTGLYDNQVLERALLVITEQSSYQQTTYLKKVPQRKIHLMTVFSILQLAILIATGFYLGSYVKLSFPFLVLLMIPIRVYILPIFVNKKRENDNVSYIDILDGHH